MAKGTSSPKPETEPTQLKPRPLPVTTKKRINIAGDLRGLHPNTLANLVPQKHPNWQPGESGFPEGEGLLACLKRMSLQPPGPPPGPDRPVREHIVWRMIQEARAGKPVLHKELWDRLEGRVAERLELEGTLLNVNVPVAQLSAEDIRLLLSRERRMLAEGRAVDGERVETEEEKET